MLKVTTGAGDITRARVDAVVVNLFEDATLPTGAAGAVDAATGGTITAALKTGDFKGKEGTSLTTYPASGVAAPRVVVVGLGREDKLSIEAVRRAAGTAVRALQATRAATAATVVHGAGMGGLDPDVCARNVAGASISMAYRFDRRTAPKDDDEERAPRLRSLLVVEKDRKTLPAVRAGARLGVHVASAQCAARDVASWSSREGTPAAIAKHASAMARRHGLRCTVMGPREIWRERMHAVLGVNQGATAEPRVVVLEHRPARARRRICLVGKGVCFDTGGISIKPAADMDKMKYDKSGAAAVLGAIEAAARLKTPVHVVGIAPLVTNMPSGDALKPGDLLDTRSGRTVEVLNTDAEGRLILADALDLAKDHEPDHTIDLATLTGAVTVALGSQAMAVVGNDRALVDKLVAAGEATHERVWELPFYPEYGKQIESKVADVKNVGGRAAGTITAGKFLETFAPASWAHLDIAGTAWNDEKPHFNGAYYPAGATGVGVRLLTHFLAAEVG